MAFKDMGTYWNDRYEKGRIWGDEPCPSVVLAHETFQENKSKNILVPGCGYGRNSVYLAQQGYNVTAVDISSTAIQHATDYAQCVGVANLTYHVGDLFDPTFLEGQTFDGIFLSNVIHLFLEKERTQLLNKLTSLLHPNGILCFSCVSIYDQSNFGIGLQVEKNTFMKHEGKLLHFYDKEELDSILTPNYNVLKQQLHTQTEPDPSGATEELQLWFVAGQKKA